MKELRYTGISLLTLFLSLGTLICCVLPLILVTLGLGAVIATLISQYPIIATLTQYKIWIFIIAACLLILTAWLLWRPGRSCPADQSLALFCNKIQVWNKRIFWMALIVWLVGSVVTYIILPLWLVWIGGI